MVVIDKTSNALPIYKEELLSVNAKVLIIWGKRDAFLLWEPQKAKIVNALNVYEKNINITEARHFIQEEEPELINDLILNFLSAQPSETSLKN